MGTVAKPHLFVILEHSLNIIPRAVVDAFAGGKMLEALLFFIYKVRRV